MNMTLTRIGLGNASGFLSALVMPVGILVLVAMMVLPLPAFLLDTFFITNILVSLLVLMVALHTYRPLDFSSFPSLLLIATVLRLGLNVASTRIILSSGHEGTSAAGKVIEAFGAFVIAGNEFGTPDKTLSLPSFNLSFSQFCLTSSSLATVTSP